MSATLSCTARWTAAVILAAELCGVSISSAADAPSTPWPTPANYAEAPADELPAPAPALQAAGPNGSGESNWVLSDEPIDEPSWYQHEYWFGPSPWDTGIELGINGSSGNNDSFSMRTGGYVKRESRFSKFDFSTYYNHTSAGGITTQDNATMDGKNDWLLDDSLPWTLFTKGALFYDEFQAFDVQVSGSTGIGYQFLKQPELNLIGRVGAGGSREIGGPDNEWVPEAEFGFEYEQKIAASHKLFCKYDYYPQMDDFNKFRMVTDAGWEIALARPSNLSLKLSVSDRYDSTPNGVKPDLLNYSIVMLMKL